jgi:hypothetical protein
VYWVSEHGVGINLYPRHIRDVFLLCVVHGMRDMNLNRGDQCGGVVQ